MLVMIRNVVKTKSVVMTNLMKDYPWMFKKRTTKGVGKTRRVIVKEFTPIVHDCGSHYAIQREKDSSPLILSKNYIL